ncbi:hypothetical protein GE21DRAFT_4392 [Neurospora crassa]|uniref:Uncharacterized protein n=1 Tax=Neurospora crassa (strain ATCC 24698 / 74-OR23-1A / CBS 708.71 / DSM 1257 / FGSC 987) TaxID=367110 RepID=Q7RYL8_NEUCR|nr:hypothetical protein NCU00110 [Neurospora crassa OR74A]EAA27998.1 hypothetical protein NCU00110 [Neurospora crassa OR74A]KHE89494.1 hypothetical protein GE21DRAFT_4392 [Neurospora crassa]|eukprot:XP_957234.1 hypothetical protein NCU00110 [Neurospora crassa OR74A]
MPRPRKSRVVPSQPTANSSSATPPVVTKPTATDPSSDIYDVSDREKERAKQRAAAVAAAQRHMNSDQAKELEDAKQRRDQAMDRLANMTSTTGTADTDRNPDAATSYSRREREESTRPSPRAPRRLTGDTSGLDLDDDMFDLDDSLEDPTITALNAGGYRSANTSSFDVGLFQRHRPRQNSVSGRDDGPVRPSSRGPTTPSVMSTLNLGLFKRRAREPSILGTAQKGRRQRSLSVTSQVSRIPMTDEEDHMDVDREAAIEDEDSGPDGESTPLDMMKRRSGASAFTGAALGADVTVPASSGAMPVDDDEEIMETGSPSRRSKKRKSLESHSGRKKRGRSVVHEQPVPEPEEEENEVIHQSIEMRDGSDSPISSPLSTPALSPVPDHIPSSPPRQSRPPIDPNDPVNAPPASDSSEAESPVAWPSLNNLTHRSYNSRRAAPVYTERLQTPELLPRLGAGPMGAVDADMSSELSSPPSLTHSPNYKAPNTAKASAVAAAAFKKATGAVKKREEEKLATEALTSLLPARRNRAKPDRKNKKGRNKENPYDITSDEGSSSSSEDETAADGDELSYIATAAARKKKEKALSAAKQKQLKEKDKQKMKPPHGTTTNGKAAAKSKPGSSEPKRTYGRAGSDKENADGADASGGDRDKEQDGEDDDDDQEPVSAMDLGEAEELPETTQMMTERLGEELLKAAKKFKEVDKWELSFEEVTQPSSPIPDAR